MITAIKNCPNFSHEKVVNFIRIVSDDLIKNAGKLVFLKSKRIGDLKAVGEFSHDEGIPIIKIATKHPEKEVLYTLVHEYAHFLQLIEGSKIWDKFENNGYEIGVIFDKKSPSEARLRCCEMIIKLELDCERRAVALIHQYNLPINIDEYIQRANLVLFKWVHSKNTTDWVKTTDKQFDSLCEICPPVFLKSYKKIPKNVESEFKKILG